MNKGSGFFRDWAEWKAMEASGMFSRPLSPEAARTVKTSARRLAENIAANNALLDRVRKVGT